jgi:hypothetical protein
LLYGLSLVTALPHDAILPPPNATMPTIRPDPHPILRTVEVGSVLDRPIARVGHGNVALEQVDWRMRGLIASLDMSRTTDESAMLVCLGISERDPAARHSGRATIEDLWDLVCETLPRHGIVCHHPAAVGPRALLVLLGGITAQVVWLSGDRLTTVAVTSLLGEELIGDAARSIAYVLDRQLTRAGPGSGPDARVRPSSESHRWHR